MARDRATALVGQLRSFRTRSAAADELVAMGEDAVSLLTRALEQEDMEPARWTILNCLGMIGAKAAVPVLAKYLDEADYQAVAHDALVRITGHDLGLVPADWLREVHGEGAAGRTCETSREEGSELDDPALMEFALEGTGTRCSREGESRYTILVDVGAGHARDVTVVFGTQDHEGSDIVIVFCDCGRARPEHYETVLRGNLHMPYGAVALRDVRGEPHFVMFNTILRAALSPVELRKSILTIARRSDRVGKQIND
jgi:hypothetical protein